MPTTITPYILGRGMAGHAIARSLSILRDQGLAVNNPIFMERGASLSVSNPEHALLCLANPHGLHTPLIVEGARAGFGAIVSEKPSSISLEQLETLRGVTAPVFVLHGYAQMWGPQTIRSMIASGELGDLVAVEGRYWQSSAAQSAVENKPPAQSWKNDPSISGPFDVYVDLATHFVDLCSVVVGEVPESLSGRLSYINAEAKHRDTYANLSFRFPRGITASGSISKTVHGAGNDLELHVIGAKKRVSWRFAAPDMLEIGVGSVTCSVPRATSDFGSMQRPFHGIGWLEGYTEILKQACTLVLGEKPRMNSMLPWNLSVMRLMLEAWPQLQKS